MSRADAQRRHVETIVRWSYLTSTTVLIATIGLCILAVVRPAAGATIALAVGVTGSVGTAAMTALAIVLKRIRTYDPPRIDGG